MEPGFSIYPKQCSAECEKLNNAAKEMLTYKSRLESVKDTISTLSGGGYSNVVNFLERAIDDVEGERKSIELLSSVLAQSIQLYEQTDARIAEGKVNGKNTDGGTEATEENEVIYTWDDYLAKLLLAIADCRSTIVCTMFESILSKGILSDDVFKDIQKILSGTYLSTYWKNGQMHFKLHFDDMTNREVVDWLKQNLGGEWDDYLARNLKREGFSVYDWDSGRIHDLRYFDDITDADLLKYINSLGESGGKRFWQQFKGNFKFLDDFNYKEFGELGTLGKFGKILGTLGTVLTIGGDVADSFYDSDTGEWTFSGNQFLDCIWDVTVDIGAGAGSAAAGAAIGSFFAPPVGTVVGAVAGIGIDFAANIGIVDMNGDGKKDSLVDGVKILGHNIVDLGEDIADTVIDWGSDAIDTIGDWGSDVIDTIGDWGSDACDWLGAAFSF